GRDVDTLQRLQDFRAKGFAGAWAWSLFNDHTGDKMAIDLGAVTSFTANPTVPSPGQPQAVANPGGIQLLANWVSPTYALPGQDLTVYQDIQTLRDTTVLLRFDMLDDQGQPI